VGIRETSGRSKMRASQGENLRENNSGMTGTKRVGSVEAFPRNFGRGKGSREDEFDVREEAGGKPRGWRISGEGWLSRKGLFKESSERGWRNKRHSGIPKNCKERGPLGKTWPGDQLEGNSACANLGPTNQEKKNKEHVGTRKGGSWCSWKQPGGNRSCSCEHR